MWIYEKKLQFPVRIRKPDLKMAKALFAQYGGPDSELAAGVRYLNQRYSMPNDVCKSILTDIGTEEYAPHYCPLFMESGCNPSGRVNWFLRKEYTNCRSACGSASDIIRHI